MEVNVCESRLSLHPSVVKYPGQSKEEWAARCVLHLFLNPRVLLSSGHMLICSPASPQDIVLLLSLLVCSKSGSPCYLLKLVPLLCHRSSQVGKGIEWQSTWRLPFPQLLWHDRQELV